MSWTFANASSSAGANGSSQTNAGPDFEEIQTEVCLLLVAVAIL